MNEWNILINGKKELVLVQKGFAFFFENNDGELVNPFFHNPEVAKVIFEEDGEFLRTMDDMVILTPNGLEIEIQAL